MPKTNAEKQKTYRERKKTEKGKVRKPRTERNDEIVQKVTDFLKSSDIQDPNDFICNSFKMVHFFHGSFNPSHEEICFLQSRVGFNLANIDVQMQEARQKVIYALMAKFDLNRTAGTEWFNRYWLHHTSEIPEDLAEKIEELWNPQITLAPMPTPNKEWEKEISTEQKKTYREWFVGVNSPEMQILRANCAETKKAFSKWLLENHGVNSER